MKLELRYLWGSPKTWQFDGNDDQLLRGMLRELGEYSADAEMRSAVLVATAEADEPIGAWNREGAARLAATIKHDLPGPPWADVWKALEDGVSGP